VRAFHPGTSIVRHLWRPEAFQWEQYASNYRRLSVPSRDLWATLSGEASYEEANMTLVEKNSATILPRRGFGFADLSANLERCKENTLIRSAHVCFVYLHSPVTNLMLNLANTLWALITFESYLSVASRDSGGVEALLAGMALQSRLAAPPYSACAFRAPSTGQAGERASSHRRKTELRFGKTNPSRLAVDRRREGVGEGCCRRSL